MRTFRLKRVLKEKNNEEVLAQKASIFSWRHAGRTTKFLA
jgi:hypothetical protein